MTTKNKKIIELIGFPGSGKTYMASRIDNKEIEVVLTDDFYELSRNIKKSRKNLETIKVIVKDIYLIYNLFVFSLTYTPKLYSLKRFIETIRYMAIYDIILKSYIKKDIILFDQGIVQYIWSYSFEDENKSLDNSKYLQKSMKYLNKKYNMTVIYYKVNYELAASRASSRKSSSPLDSKGREYLNKLYKLHQLDYEKLMNAYPDNRKGEVSSYKDLKKMLNLYK